MWLAQRNYSHNSLTLVVGWHYFMRLRKTRDSSPCRISGLRAERPRNSGSISSKSRRFFLFPKRPDWRWWQPSLLRGIYPPRESSRALNSHVMPRLWMCGVVPSPHYLLSWRAYGLHFLLFCCFSVTRPPR